MKLLENIKTSGELKKLNIEELNQLAAEIREFLIDNVSKTGGHLSSNLGTVELTLALHKVFDVYNDKIVWDVGHQSYTHKILTGRKDDFINLRKMGGISGFPKTEESMSDVFNTGHSSTSISAALGFSKAGELSGKDYSSVAVIGDGALTGGMAYEAINHAGSQRTPLIVVLNDNGMSISKNVGGLSKHLNKIRNNSRYFSLKDDIKKILDKIPVLGRILERCIQAVKHGIKNIFIQNEIFENMGMTYLGPVDGHNIKELMVVLSQAKKMRKPVIVHVHTVKGKGYKYAEKNPDVFHGIQKFDPNTGTILGIKKESYSDIFGKTICECAEKNDKVLGITAAMPEGTGFLKFATLYPKRFFDVGIAEQHAVTFAAGLAKSGYIPVFAVYSSFLQRAYDQILHDVALQNLHVVFAVDRAGVVGNDGETHQGIYDLSYLSHIPNMTILAPSSAEEMELMIKFAVEECSGPVAVRYPRGEAKNIKEQLQPVEMGIASVVKEGTDVLFVSIGTILEEVNIACEKLSKKKISTAVINSRFLKPLDKAKIKTYSEKCKVIVTVEDNVTLGGLGSMVEGIVDREVIKLGYPDTPIQQGSVSELRKAYGIDGDSIFKNIEKRINKLKVENRKWKIVK